MRSRSQPSARITSANRSRPAASRAITPPGSGISCAIPSSTPNANPQLPHVSVPVRTSRSSSMATVSVREPSVPQAVQRRSGERPASKGVMFAES